MDRVKVFTGNISFVQYLTPEEIAQVNDYEWKEKKRTKKLYVPVSDTLPAEPSEAAVMNLVSVDLQVLSFCMCPNYVMQKAL